MNFEKYNQLTAEKKIYDFWEKNNSFKAAQKKKIKHFQ